MKKLLIILLLTPLISFTQISDWYKVDLSRIGYKHNTYTFEEVPTVFNNGNYPDVGNFKNTVAKGGSFELSVDLITKHVYFNLDAGSLLDMGATLFQFKDKERWFNNKQYYVDFIDLIPMRLAFGSNITPYLGVYLGGQYSYTTLGIRYKGPIENDGVKISAHDVRMGGNTYGFGGHVVGAFSAFNLRYSYMYNWTSQASTFQGNRIDNEIVLSFGFSILGVFVKYRHSYNVSNAGYLPTDRSHIFKKDYETGERSYQSSQIATKSDISVGIYATGIFSGVTKGASKALTDVERGLEQERREDKKRKIEWKE